MSFFKSLFGGGGKAPKQPKQAKQAEHKGFIIEARPYKEGGQYQLAGLISKEIGGARKEYRFVRADRFTTELRLPEEVVLTLPSLAEVVKAFHAHPHDEQTFEQSLGALRGRA